MSKQKLFAVAWRSGGTHRFQWHWMFADYKTREEAVKVENELRRVGYATILYSDARTARLIGLPETYDATPRSLEEVFASDSYGLLDEAPHA